MVAGIGGRGKYTYDCPQIFSLQSVWWERTLLRGGGQTGVLLPPVVGLVESGAAAARSSSRAVVCISVCESEWRIR